MNQVYASVAGSATRLLFPGAVMSVAFVVISPAFLVSAHCAAHVFIPLLFH